MNAAMIREKLASEVETTTWPELAPHQARGALLLCDARAELIAAAVAIATDDAARVADWLVTGAIRRPDADEAAAFADDARFRFVIVQPFVVATSATDEPARDVASS